jgi:predicted CXXCH cytochrome family protein
MAMMGERALRRPVAVLAAAGLVAFALAAGASVADAGSAPVVIGGARPADPSVSEGRVVWADRRAGNWDIYAFSSATADTTRLTSEAADQIQPDIEGDLVVWSDFRHGEELGGGADIYLYDFATGVETRITSAIGDQIAPSIAGDFIVWEDYRNGYSPAIYAYDLSTDVEWKVASGYANTMERPEVGGVVVVFEDYNGVRAYDLAAKSAITISTSDAAEHVPATDGDYVVWARSNGTDLDLVGYDLATKTEFEVAAEDGEQTFPVVADGVAYWIDNKPGQRLHVDTKTLPDGPVTTFNSYGVGDLADVAVTGDDVVWLERAGAKWQLRGILSGSGGTVVTALRRAVSAVLAWNPFRLAEIATAGDTTAPEFVSATVDPGQTGVEPDEPIALYFSEDLDAKSVGTHSVVLTDETGEPAAASVRYSALADALVVTPETPLSGSYTLEVAGVADARGNVLDEPVLMTFSTTTILADTVAPSKPGIQEARVNGLTEVEVSWNPSSDDVGVTGYQIYRHTEPMSLMNLGDAELVSTVGAVSSASVPVTETPIAEATTKYTFYYALRAFDAATNYSALSANVAPDPHGTYVVGGNTRNCQGCHDVHGTTSGRLKLGARSAEACYLCHGDTDKDTSYGYGSTINVEAQFKGYTGQTKGSEHRTPEMMAIQRECDGCHTPHRKPYNPSDPATEYNDLLRSQTATGPDTYDYNTSALNGGAGMGNDFCFNCHGASATPITIVSAATDYSDTGGDHETGYGTSAHSVEVAANPGGNPTIQCEACHSNHGSAVDRLIDYRMSGTDTTGNDQSGLCYKCHAGGPEAGSPNTWNSRNIQTEFARNSAHPYAATVATGGPGVQAGSWSQTTEAEFNTDTLTSVETTPVGDGAVQLERVGGATVITAFYDGFEGGDFNNTLGVGGAWTTVDSYNTKWYVDTTNPGTGSYSAHAENTNGSGTGPWDIEKTGLDLSGMSNITFEYDIAWGGVLESADYIQVSYLDGTWQQLVYYDPQDTHLQTQDWFHDSFTIPNTATGIRFRYSANFNDDDVWVDEVRISTTVSTPGGFAGSGNVVTPNIVVPGTHQGWKALTVNADVPVDTSMTVDVIDIDTGSPFSGYDDLPISTGSNVFGLALPAGIDHATDPQIKLRADLYGDVTVPVARSVSDYFGDDAFDTSLPLPRWYDVPTLGGATDPDVVVPPQTVDLEEWPSTTIAGNGWTTVVVSDPGDDVEWRIDTGSGNPAYTAEFRNTQDNSRGTEYIYETYDLAGYTGLELSFDWRTTTQVELPGTDAFTVDYSTNGGADWNQLWTAPSEPTGWTGVNITSGIPAQDNVLIRFYASLNYSNEWIEVDNVHVTRDGDPTSIWPKEAGGFLTLRGEGVDFAGTSDEGYYVYMSAADYGWFTSATDGWEMVSQVMSETVTDPDGRSGVMMRSGSGYGTGSGEALEADAMAAGVYLTGDGNVQFVTRSSDGGSTSAQTVSSVTAPEWVKLAFDGTDSWTGWYSSDGSAWTEIGSAATFTPGSALALGLAQTSGDNGTFADASFDDFSVTELVSVPDATKTPMLLDWTVTYDYVPPAPAGDGELTCVNCHNMHVVETGSGVWDEARVSDPDNTKTLWSDVAASDYSDFCLRCHDGTAPTQQVGSSIVVPYGVGFTDMDSGTYPFFPGWDKTASGATWGGSAHANSNVGQMDPGCDTCHDPHASDNDRLTALTAQSSGGGMGHPNAVRDNSSTYAEEDLCLVCHTSDRTPNCTTAGGGGQPCHSGGSVSVDDIDVQTAFGRTYTHPIGTSGAHSDTEDASDLGDGNRHAECVDCHDPHAATAAEPLLGAYGVTASSNNGNWGVPTGWSAFRYDGVGTEYQAYLCFRCHSSYVTLPAATTDIAQQFNPDNDSGHNVLGNVWPKTTFNVGGTDYSWTYKGTFTGGWSTSSTMACTDCHEDSGGGAAGPHGSAYDYILKWGDGNPWYTADLRTSSWDSARNICNNCHNRVGTYHTEGGHTEGSYMPPARCDICHVRIPHGWKRPRLLISTEQDTEGTRFISTDPDALKAIEVKAYTGSWDTGDCEADCYGDHNNASNPWP